MIRWPQQPREEYEAIQRGRTAAKWTLNGITREEVRWYCSRLQGAIVRPIICLGVRNGLEVDIFRDVFSVPVLPVTETISWWDHWGVVGVELHEQGWRPDVWTGSFDAMPQAWAGQFPLVYSNALDHAYDPVATAAEWRRVATPGALLALSLAVGNTPTETDPIADITDDDLRDLFGGELVACGELIASSTLPADHRWLLWRLP